MVVHTTMYLEYHTIVFCCGRKVLLRPEKKVLVVCLAGCAVVSVYGSGDYDLKKKSSSRLSGGLCYVMNLY